MKRKVPTLTLCRVRPYPDEELRRWKDGRSDLLDSKQIAPFIRRILCDKAQRRRKGMLARGKKSGDRRFFGESYVASQIAHDKGWYGSFKWLTSVSWADETSTTDSFGGEFANALRSYFPDAVENLERYATKLRNLPDSRKPVAPDLWLITNGTHRFIEVKLKRDKVHSHQLAGLAVIAASLADTVRVRVEVAAVCSEAEATARYERRLEQKFLGMQQEFDRFYRRLRAR